jgi:hypothetical protein
MIFSDQWIVAGGADGLQGSARRSRRPFHDRRPALAEKEPCFSEEFTQPLQGAEREPGTLRREEGRA